MTTSDIINILKIEPPMLMLDKVEELLPGEYCHAIKHVTANEWFFPPHYPQYPIMPGVLQLEAMIQASHLAILSGKTEQTDTLPPVILAAMDKIRFFSPITPGDMLTVIAKIDSSRMGLVQCTAYIEVNGKKICESKATHKINS